jgi:S-adenosylmethionine decarboxylase proenzyme, Bacillus form
VGSNVSFLGPVIRERSKKSIRKPAAGRIAAAPAEPAEPVPFPSAEHETKDYFVERDGVRFAGTHLLIELWKARHLTDVDRIEQALRESVAACHATLLHVHLHHFASSGGVSGVAVLAESHMSIHTWPERDYAAIDLFMCGHCDPYKAVPVLKRHLEPEWILLNEQKRGLMP